MSVTVGAIFVSRLRARHLAKLVVLFNHWFMPYKVEREGNLSNVGQQKCLRLQRSSPWP